MRKRDRLIIIAVSVITVSCSTPRDITYMQGLGDGMTETVASPRRLTLQSGDRVSVTVSSPEPELAEAFNLAVSQTRIGQKSGTSGNGQVAAYTVSADGAIDFPVLGAVHVAGLERGEVSALIKGLLEGRGLLKDATVTVEFLSATVSVLGDVSSPGEYTIDRDELTILQALSKAGDLNITGMRENVLVVREENGKNTAYRVDLTDAGALMSSPAYYLQQNDVVYVEPNNMKKRQATTNANTVLTPSFWLSVASFLTTIGVLIFK